jgi:hypothetical protein
MAKPDCAAFYSRSHRAVIRVYDAAGNVIETHTHKGDFREAQRESPRRCFTRRQRDVSEMFKDRKKKGT